MKALVCKHCGSHTLTQTGEYFICQYCKSKYILDDINKDKISNTQNKPIATDLLSLDELYKLARAANENDNKLALKYYTSILEREPNSWEAMFYSVVLNTQLESHDIAYINSLAMSLANNLYPVLNLLKMDLIDKTAQHEFIEEICSKTFSIAEMLYDISTKNYLKDDIPTREKFVQRYANNIYATLQILYTLGNHLTSLYQDAYAPIAIKAWKRGIEMHVELTDVLININENSRIIRSYEKKIKKYDGSYKAPEIKNLSIRKLKTIFKSCFLFTKSCLTFIIIVFLIILFLLLLLL